MPRQFRTGRCFHKGLHSYVRHASSIDLHLLSVQLDAVHAQQMEMFGQMDARLAELRCTRESLTSFNQVSGELNRLC